MGRTRADLFVKIDGKGNKRETLLLTKAVRQKNGTFKEVTTEHDPRILREIYRKFRSHERATKADRSRFQIGIWYGEKAPVKGQEVRNTGKARLDRETNRVVNELGRVTPLGTAPQRDPERPTLYVVSERTTRAGISRVVGFSKDLDLARSKMSKLERDGQMPDGGGRSAMYAELASIVSKHEPGNGRLKEGLKRLLDEDRLQKERTRERNAPESSPSPIRQRDLEAAIDLDQLRR